MTNQGPGCDVTATVLGSMGAGRGKRHESHWTSVLVKPASWCHGAGYRAAAMRASSGWYDEACGGENGAADQDVGSLKPGCCDLCACECGKRCAHASSPTSMNCWPAHKRLLYPWTGKSSTHISAFSLEFTGDVLWRKLAFLSLFPMMAETPEPTQLRHKGNVLYLCD